MVEPTPEDDARVRWMVINLTRVIGAAIVLVGFLGLNGQIPIPPVAAYAFIAFGLFDVFGVPQILAKKWRTPPQ